MPIWVPLLEQLIQGVLGQSFSNIGAAQDAIFVVFRDVLGALGGGFSPFY